MKKNIIIYLILLLNTSYANYKDVCHPIINQTENTEKVLSGEDLYNIGVEIYESALTENKYKEAFCYLNAASEQNHLDSKALISEFYENGHFVQKDYNKAFSLSKEASEQGSALALNNLGNYYTNGIGVDKDLEKGASYYKKAIEKGDLEVAKLNLAVAHFYGLGIHQDTEKAILLTKEVISSNKLMAGMAMANLGGFYSALNQNKLAFEWTQKGALLDNLAAQTNLGFMYANGIGVIENKDKSIYWLTKAAESGYSEAYYILGTLYEKGNNTINRDLSKATHYYILAVKKNHGMAKNNLATLLINGKGIEKNENEAFKLYLDAAQNNNVAFSMYALYQIYSKGTKAIPQDPQKAQYWLEKAKENGLQL